MGQGREGRSEQLIDHPEIALWALSLLGAHPEEKSEEKLDKAGTVVPAGGKSFPASSSRARGILFLVEQAALCRLHWGWAQEMLLHCHCQGDSQALALTEPLLPQDWGPLVPWPQQPRPAPAPGRENAAKGWEGTCPEPAPRQLRLLTYGKGWLLSLVSSQAHCKAELKAFNGPLTPSLQIQRDREHNKLSKYDLTA